MANLFKSWLCPSSWAQCKELVGKVKEEANRSVIVNDYESPEISSARDSRYSLLESEIRRSNHSASTRSIQNISNYSKKKLE